LFLPEGLVWSSLIEEANVLRDGSASRLREVSVRVALAFAAELLALADERKPACAGVSRSLAVRVGYKADRHGGCIGSRRMRVRLVKESPTLVQGRTNCAMTKTIPHDLRGRSE